MTQEQPTPLEQLKRAFDAGVIDQATFDAAAAAMHAQLSGSGAVAQGQGATAVGATAVGAAGVGVARDNYGAINTGVIIELGTRPGASSCWFGYN